MSDEYTELEKKIEERLPYYFKGIGTNGFQKIVCDGEIYLLEPEHRQKYQKGVNRAIELIKRLYSSIPFDSLGDKDFQPLFEVNNQLPVLETRINEFLQTPTQELYKEVETLCIQLMELGDIYRQSIISLRDRIRQLPSHQKYRVLCTDIKGEQYELTSQL